METEFILRQFIDFQKLIYVTPCGNGHINDSYQVKIQQDDQAKSWFLQRLNHDIFRQPEAVMHNIWLVATHQEAQNYPLQILMPMPTRCGAVLYLDDAGSYWRLFPFFEKTITLDQVATPEQAHEAARAFGLFSRSLSGLEIERLQVTIPGFHNGVQRLVHFKTMLKNALPGRLQTAQAEVEIIFRNELIFNKIAYLRVPIRAVHHDTKINNLLLDEVTLQARCVIDLDTVMPGVVFSDFGDLVRTSTSAASEDEADLSKVEMRWTFYEALLEGFLSEMHDTLTAVEREHLPLSGAWLTLMQAMRFLGDYLAGDVYYKTAYPTHNLVRAKNQLALFQSMTEQLQ